MRRVRDITRLLSAAGVAVLALWTSGCSIDRACTCCQHGAGGCCSSCQAYRGDAGQGDGPYDHAQAQMASAPPIGRFHPVPTRPVFPTGDPLAARPLESMPRPVPVPTEKSNPGPVDPDSQRQKQQREQREELRMENMPSVPGY